MSKTHQIKARHLGTNRDGLAAVAAQQTGPLAELAAKSPLTTSLSVLQAKADSAPMQFAWPKWWKKLRGKNKGASYDRLIDADGGAAESSSDQEHALASEEGSDAEGDLEALDWADGLDRYDGIIGTGLDVLQEPDAAQGPLYANLDVRHLTEAAAFKKRLKRFIKYARRVDPEELGGESFASLRAKVQDTIDRMPTAEVDPDDLTERSGLLAHAARAGESAPDPSDFDIELTDDRIEEDVDKAQARLNKIVAKVRGKLSKLTDRQQEVAIVALALIQQEIQNLIEKHKSAGSAARVILLAGPAGYLEDKVLPVLISHIPGDVKESVPWSANRKRRNKAAQIGEGGVDIAWNSATLATDALSLGAASAGTAAIGGSYKAALASAGVKRAGGSDAKATATGVVVFILETLQGLIPFYSGAAGIGGGVRGAGKAVVKTAKKAKKKSEGYGMLPDQSNSDDGPEIFQLLTPRLEYGDALRQEAAEYLGNAGIAKLVTKLDAEMIFLRRQMKKSISRL